MAGPRSDGNGTVKGLVIGANGPVSVYLQSADENPTRYYDGYKVITDEHGSFAFLEVKPGTYHINAEGSGFETGSHSSTTITLHANETRDGVRIAMIPVTQVCGRVTENGTPKETWVYAWRFDSEFGTFSKHFLPSTGADGSYLFAGLAPGTYFLQGYTTWYPGAASVRDAKPVVVGPDAKPSTKCSYDIPLQNTGCRGTKVRGSIARVPGLEDQQYKVSFREQNSAGGSVWARIDFIADKTLKGGDSFDDTLCPGTYEVVLTDNTRMSWWNETLSHKVVFDTQEVSVGEEEVNGLVLSPHRLASITGEVHFENITRRGICPGRGGQSVSLLREGDGQFQSVDLGDDNRFAFQNVAPGDYQMYIGSILREAVFIKSLIVDGRPYPGRHFSITQAAPAKMDITLSGDVTRAEGHVSPDVRGEPRWEVAWTRPRASVSGRIAGGQSQGLTVNLRSARHNSDASYEYSASPTPDGTFHFDEIDPGVYTLGVEGKDFVTNEYGALNGGKRGTPIVVKRGARIEGLTLNALKLSAVCGRVTDTAGAPQSRVRILIQSFENGYIHGGGSNPDHITTDENGFFRAEGFVPGDYFISYSGARDSRFFSSDGSLRAATPIHLRAGHDTGCPPSPRLTLELPAVPAARHAISGTVIGNLPPAVGDRVWVSLMDRNDNGAQVFAGRSSLDAGNKFRIENVPNGRYILELQSGYGPEPRMWSGPFPPRTHLLVRQQIEVLGADVSDVKITPMELPTVTGHVHFTNLPESWKGKTFDKTTTSIMLVPRTDQAPSSAQLSSDETFSVGPEDAGDYEVRLRFDFNQLYIRSIRFNGHPISGRYLRLRPNEPAQLEIEISGNGGQLNFTVLPDSSLPRPEPPVTEVCRSLPVRALQGMQVILLPDPLFTDGSNPASSLEKLIFRATPVGDGDRTWLQIGNLPPGKYRAIAAENLSAVSFANLHDISRDERALLESLAGLAQPLIVEPNSTQKIALPDKTIDLARLAAKMGLALDTAILGTR